MGEVKPLFILYGNSSMLNRGCEAILRSTVEILRTEFGPCRFVNSPPRYFEPEELGDVEDDVVHVVPAKRVFPGKSWFTFHMRKRAFMFKPTRRIFGTRSEVFGPYLAESTAGLAIGGDNFSFDYGAPWTQFAINRSILRHGKPLVIWGASIGPFDRRPKFERFAAQELSKATLICARESETVSYLKSLGIADNVRLVADPAFTLEPHEVDLDRPDLKIVQEPCIGINISPLMARYWKASRSWLDCATENVKGILENIALPVLFVPHVVQPGNNDYHFMKQIMIRLAAYRDRMAILGPEYDCRQIKWVISNLAAFIGARTHSTIAALSSNVPTLSIAYSVKARGINRDIFGHLDWLVHFEALEGEVLSCVTQRLLRSESSVRNHLVDFMPAYKEKARQAAKYVKEIIQSW
jgi:colanic acid/amylovoran biosynthesis protein